MLISLIRNLKLILYILHIPALYISALENDQTVNKRYYCFTARYTNYVADLLYIFNSNHFLNTAYFLTSNSSLLLWVLIPFWDLHVFFVSNIHYLTVSYTPVSIPCKMREILKCMKICKIKIQVVKFWGLKFKEMLVWNSFHQSPFLGGGGGGWNKLTSSFLFLPYPEAKLGKNEGVWIF